jgi:uncharacterized protein YfaA (DUF2138 family)
MNARKDFWLSLTVISCFVAILFLPACALSFLATAKRDREPPATERSRRIRIDLRIPTLLIGLGSATLAWCSYRRYARHLSEPK